MGTLFLAKEARLSVQSLSHDINQSKILCDPPPIVMEIKTKVNKWDLIKLNTFGQQRE